MIRGRDTEKQSAPVLMIPVMLQNTDASALLNYEAALGFSAMMRTGSIHLCGACVTDPLIWTRRERLQRRLSVFAPPEKPDTLLPSGS